MKGIRRRLKAGLWILTALSLIPVTAWAAETGRSAKSEVVTGDITGLNPAAIDPAAVGKLHITKTGGNPFDEPAAGQLPVGPVAGQIIQISRVKGVNLVGADWERIRRMSVSEAKNNGLETAKTMAADGSGKVVFSNLPVGLYLVSDRKPADTSHKYPRIQPFLITVPTGNANLHTWNFNTEVTPKMMPEETPAPGPSPNPASPRTAPAPGRGTLSKMAVTGAMAAGSALLAAALLWAGILILGGRRRRNENCGGRVCN